MAPHWHHISNTPEGPHVLFGGVADDAEVVRVIDRQRHRLRLRTYTEALYVIRIYVCMCVCMHARTYVCMYVHTSFVLIKPPLHILTLTCFFLIFIFFVHVCTYKFRPNQTTHTIYYVLAL